jgi:hypothetical protein
VRLTYMEPVRAVPFRIRHADWPHLQQTQGDGSSCWSPVVTCPAAVPGAAAAQREALQTVPACAAAMLAKPLSEWNPCVRGPRVPGACLQKNVFEELLDGAGKAALSRAGRPVLDSAEVGLILLGHGRTPLRRLLASCNFSWELNTTHAGGTTAAVARCVLVKEAVRLTNSLRHVFPLRRPLTIADALAEEALYERPPLEHIAKAVANSSSLADRNVSNATTLHHKRLYAIAESAVNAYNFTLEAHKRSAVASPTRIKKLPKEYGPRNVGLHFKKNGSTLENARRMMMAVTRTHDNMASMLEVGLATREIWGLIIDPVLNFGECALLLLT